LAPLLLYPGDRPGWAHPHLVGGEPDPTIRNKVKVAFLLRPHERGVQQMHRFGVHKSLGGPWTSMFKMEKGNYSQSFYWY